MMGGYGGMMGGYGNGFWGMGVIGMVLQLAILIGVIYFIVHLVRGFTNQQHSKKPNNALEIVEERYAKGEILEEEFKKMKNDSIFFLLTPVILSIYSIKEIEALFNGLIW